MIVLALSAIQSLAQSVYGPYTFTTLAGGGGVTSPDQAASAARFNNPGGVAVEGLAPLLERSPLYPGANVLLGMGNNEPTVAADPNNPLRVAVATFLGIRVSTNGGVSFEPRVWWRPFGQWWGVQCFVHAACENYFFRHLPCCVVTGQIHRDHFAIHLGLGSIGGLVRPSLPSDHRQRTDRSDRSRVSISQGALRFPLIP